VSGCAQSRGGAAAGMARANNDDMFFRL